MTLHSDERKAIVHYRMDKSENTLAEAKAVAGLKYWSLTANRLYYAAYYACVALLINNGIEASSHKGVTRMVGYHFVKEGILAAEDARLVGRLFTMRQTGDYDDLFDWSEEDVAPLIPQVEAFIEKIKGIIEL